MRDQQHSSTSTDFLRQLRREMLKSEVSRINIIAILCATIATFLLTVTVVFPELLVFQRNPSPNGRLIFLGPVPFGVLIVYALIVRRYLIKRISEQRECSATFRYSAAAFEAIFPTVLIFILSYEIDPIFLLVSPLVILYAVLIFSTVLQMDPRIAFFSSVVSSAGYIAAYLWFHRSIVADEYHTWLLTPNEYSGRALMLLLCGLLAAFAASQFKKHVLSLAAVTDEKNRITHTFGQHVSPQVVDRLLMQKTKLTSEIRNVCVMFLDIRDFTSFSENRDPEAVVSTLNQLFTFMIEITNYNDGIINKFLGDGFMAVFGAPFSGGSDCMNAVKASREIVLKLKRVNDELGENLRIGIGLHAGEALAGDVGSTERKEYTIMGDVVNVASRIEGLNKAYNSQILISETVYEQLAEKESYLKDIGLVTVKGRKRDIRIYQVDAEEHSEAL